MGSTEYSFKQLAESEKPQAPSCQRAYCQELSTWKATIPVKRYNGFARNIFLCDRHKVKLEKKIGQSPAGPIVDPIIVSEPALGSADTFDELEELE
jgi:hypothetical protein